MPNARTAMGKRDRSPDAEWACGMEQAARDEEAARRRLAEATGLRLPELIAGMRALGFDAESARLLFLAPVVGVAGADGAVSAAERAVVWDLARRGEIDPGSGAGKILERWLERPPAGAELDRMVALAVLDALSAHRGDEIRGGWFLPPSASGELPEPCSASGPSPAPSGASCSVRSEGSLRRRRGPSGETTACRFELLGTGDRAFEAMLAAIVAARRSIRLETYICVDCELTRRFREALVDARRRGVAVTVLLDAFGSLGLRGNFWQPLVETGGVVRWFNPLRPWRASPRNHRKLLVCDDAAAFIGGFNLASEYEGDGVTRGWRDAGLAVSGPMVRALAESFDLLCAKADMRRDRWHVLRRRLKEIAWRGERWTVLLNIPSFRRHLINGALTADLARARSVGIAAAYFLPTRRLRKTILRLARSGARVQLVLAGRSDVGLAQWAGRHLYRRFLRAGVELYEYQPQVLHAKLVLADDTAYVGSCNLDLRSLNFNYELMSRVTDEGLADELRGWFDDALEHCRAIRLAEWERRSRWTRVRERCAYVVLARLDPLIARWQISRLR